MADRFAIILAAGKGTRMKSPRPKVLHEVGGRAMLAWSVALAMALGCKRSIVVVGPDMPALSEAAGKLVGAGNGRAARAARISERRRCRARCAEGTLTARRSFSMPIRHWCRGKRASGLSPRSTRARPCACWGSVRNRSNRYGRLDDGRWLT
ncbi:MAG: NTP transferase domain-containing protein [Hyphomonadaceae bacterium]